MSAINRASTALIGTVMAVLIAVDAALISSDLDNAVRYGLGGAVVVALVVGAFQLGRTRRES
ncbi:hypothetical protein [Streptomyces sulphureus]|uniref:hypothetical protein n=1 Tax=Streptomyces sulphureus TaxID=47758 RepID=UPI000367AF3C|nr:hypothetical protein [Streptomyces sulphureus]